MAGAARLRTTARGVLLAWLLAFAGEGVAAAACCELSGEGRDPAAEHRGDHGPASHHSNAPRGPEHRHCPLPELRGAAFLPAKAPELPLPRPMHASPLHGAACPPLARAHARRMRPRAPPPAEILRLVPRLRI